MPDSVTSNFCTLAPSVIVPTGKRESIEPKVDGIAIWMVADESIHQFSEYLDNNPLGLQGCL